MKNNTVTIINFEKQYTNDFKSISDDWFESDFFKQHFSVGDYDRKILADPKKHIIDKGGHIFFAKLGDQIVGTVALIPRDHDSFELSKMGVLQKYRGLKISDLLMESALEYSRAQGKKRIWLESIHILTAALALFKKYGFNEIPLGSDSHYSRADLKMELLLTPDK